MFLFSECGWPYLGDNIDENNLNRHYLNKHDFGHSTYLRIGLDKWL